MSQSAADLATVLLAAHGETTDEDPITRAHRLGEMAANAFAALKREQDERAKKIEEEAKAAAQKAADDVILREKLFADYQAAKARKEEAERAQKEAEEAALRAQEEEARANVEKAIEGAVELAKGEPHFLCEVCGWMVADRNPVCAACGQAYELPRTAEEPASEPIDPNTVELAAVVEHEPEH